MASRRREWIWFGIGGMLTKIKAADLARRSGTTVIIAKGDEKDILPRLMNHEELGTSISPLISKVESRKRYFLAGMKTSHVTIQIDTGAVQALRSGSSLLPIGVVAVKENSIAGILSKLCKRMKNQSPSGW